MDLPIPCSWNSVCVCNLSYDYMFNIFFSLLECSLSMCRNPMGLISKAIPMIYITQLVVCFGCLQDLLSKQTGMMVSLSLLGTEIAYVFESENFPNTCELVIYQDVPLKHCIQETRGMAHWLRALADLVRDLGLVPSSHFRQVSAVYNSSSGKSNALF